ncbi:MAG TPA: hypothetical protein VMF91_16970 [Bryobacteraceae bacterium]|nr:hypothetical protein [Bryobacteraceae bacterium]
MRAGGNHKWRHLEEMVEAWSVGHPFSCLGDYERLLPIVRNTTALDEAVPLLRDAPIYGSPGTAEILDEQTWAEGVAIAEANDRRCCCSDWGAWQLQNFADYLKNRTSANANGAVRMYFCLRLGFKPLPDFAPATIEYLRRVALGLSHPESEFSAACKLALRLSVKPIANALRCSLALSCEKPVSSIRPIPLTLAAEDCVIQEHFSSERFLASLEAWFLLNKRWCRDVAQPQ